MKTATADDWFSSLPWIDREEADIDKYISSLKEETPFDISARLREWKDRGVVVFERVVSTELIDAFTSDIAYLKRHHRDFELEVELKGLFRPLADCSDSDLDSDGFKFNNIQTISKAAGLLSLTKEVVVFLAHIFQSNPVVLQSLTFWKGSQQPIHIDYPYVRCQTKLAHLVASWIPLEDVHPDAGPLAYYPGSHRSEVSGFFDWGRGSVLYEKDSLRTPAEFAEFLARQMNAHGVRKEIFCPRRGDVLIWHGNLCHEGTAVADTALTRKSYVTHYTSFDAYPKEHMKPDALKRQALIQANGGYSFEFPWVQSGRRLPSHLGR